MNTQKSAKPCACPNDRGTSGLNNPKRRILKRVAAAFIRDGSPKWWCDPVGGTRLSKSERMARDGFRCIYCGLDLRGRPSEPTTDHVIPKCIFISSAEANQSCNLVTCCLDCNRAKADWFPKHPADRAWWSRDNYIEAARDWIKGRRGWGVGEKWRRLREPNPKPSDS
jgi:5-methylcytosine-specific restriction endonuclease McrA